MDNQLLRSNLKFARSRWKCDLNQSAIQLLKALTNRYQFSIADGDLIWLERGWYATHTGLIRLASRNRCAGIHCKLVANFCDPQTQRWAFEATVYKTKTCRGFVGYGDADPSNVSFLSKVPKCGLPKLVLSTELCGKPTVSESAPLRRSVPSPNRRNLLVENPRSCLRNPPTGTTADGLSEITSANLFVSINSTPPWSSRTRRTSVESKFFVKPPANRLRISSRTWPIGPKKIAMPYSASSTAISARKKVPRETPNLGPA